MPKRIEVPPQGLTPADITRLYDNMNPEGSVQESKKNFISFVKQSYDNPETLSERVDLTLKETHQSDEDKNKLNAIKERLKECLSSYSSQTTSASHARSTTSLFAKASGSGTSASSSPSTKRSKMKSGLKLTLPTKTSAEAFWLHMEKKNFTLSFRREKKLYLSPCELRDRFPKGSALIPCRADTNVNLSLHANRILISDTDVAIACQYPLQSQLETHIEMLFENRTPALCVLTSKNEMDRSIEAPENAPHLANKMMSDYFISSGQYGKYQTNSQLIKEIDLKENVKANLYHFTILDTGSKLSVTIPTFHVLNWPDQEAISTNSLLELAKEVNQTVAKINTQYRSKGGRSSEDPNKLLPVIHCRAGVGRTGTLIAAMAIEKQDPKVTLEKIVMDIRSSRNAYMVQKEEQMETLVDLCTQTGRKLD